MPVFGKVSKANLAQAHPELQRLLIAAIKVIDFRILDSMRGRDEQELAFARGHSKAHFGQSAHNYSPSIAVDLFPKPYDWNNKQSFIDLWRVIGWWDGSKGIGLAKALKIPIRWGGDWNMNGRFTDDGWDFPHFELYPWRSWAKKPGVTLYKGKG